MTGVADCCVHGGWRHLAAKSDAFGVQEQMGELGALLRAKEAELSRLHSQLAASPDGASDLPLAALDGTGEVTAARPWLSHLKACGQVNWSALACASTCSTSCQHFIPKPRGFADAWRTAPHSPGDFGTHIASWCSCLGQ